ncbi:hypothetical protein D3C81_1985800 [compost metagenome]
MGGAHHRYRKAVLRMRPQQNVLAGNLIPGVVPERVGQGRFLRNERACRGLLISRGGADEYILARYTREQPDIRLHMLRHIADPVDYRVEAPAGQQLPDRGFIPDIPLQQLGPFRDECRAVAAVQQV